ncbi:MAG: dTMP kinase [Methanomassiliicoccales archaeon]|jgi:dTMP kinase|nr:dTMP kinase [Methanomassiliicoccales archaeon]
MTTAFQTVTREESIADIRSIDLASRGRFFVFEGIDGSGKTTISSNVYRLLRTETTREIILTTEPTDTWLGSAVRRAYAENLGPFVEALLFVADRSAHTANIQSWIDSGKIVLSDRYYASTLAYQGASLIPIIGERALDWLRLINEPIIRKPDLTFFLQIPPEVGIERMRARSEKTKFERLEFLREVDRLYRMIAKDDDSFVLIDATRPIDAIVSEIVHLIKKNL